MDSILPRSICSPKQQPGEVLLVRREALAFEPGLVTRIQLTSVRFIVRILTWAEDHQQNEHHDEKFHVKLLIPLLPGLKTIILGFPISSVTIVAYVLFPFAVRKLLVPVMDVRSL